MTKATGISTVIILIVIIALAYLVYQSTTNEPEEIVQEEQEQETILATTTLEVASSSDFTILLESKPTTGFSWMADFESEFIKLNSQDFISDTGTTTEATTTDEVGDSATTTEPEMIVGQGGQEKFEFTALQAGQTDITFTYSRPWESVQPLEIVIYHITITDDSDNSEPEAENPEDDETEE